MKPVKAAPSSLQLAVRLPLPHSPSVIPLCKGQEDKISANAGPDTSTSTKHQVPGGDEGLLANPELNRSSAAV